MFSLVRAQIIAVTNFAITFCSVRPDGGQMKEQRLLFSTTHLSFNCSYLPGRNASTDSLLESSIE